MFLFSLTCPFRWNCFAGGPDCRLQKQYRPLLLCDWEFTWKWGEYYNILFRNVKKNTVKLKCLMIFKKHHKHKDLFLHEKLSVNPCCISCMALTLNNVLSTVIKSADFSFFFFLSKFYLRNNIRFYSCRISEYVISLVKFCNYF